MIKTFKLYIPVMVVLTSLFLCSFVIANAPDKRANENALTKTATIDLETVDGNRLYNFLNNRGAWGTSNNPLGYSTFWPGRDGSPASFAQGVWVAGLVDGDIRTACSDHAYEYNPGHILPDGTPDDPDNARHQILKINKADLMDEGLNNPDYDAWVTDLYQLGAPVLKAKDGSDSLSASGKRIPAMIGDQTLWMVYNDAAPGPHSYYGSRPIGLEIQNTLWVFNRPDAFGDMLFTKFLLINKGTNTLDSAYIGLWFDIDLGDANDDLVFCDTTLSLGAFWNDGTVDTYYDIAPSVGADFFQGPIVPSEGDTANVSGEKVPNFKNLGMTAFAKYIRNGPADAEDPSNAVEVYNFMRGLNGLGQEVIDPKTGQPTKFVNISDPEAGTGWIDGVELTSADRRMLMSSGPFTLAPWEDTNGDGIPQVGEPGVQEVVGGFLVAQGTSAKNSCTRLKQVDELAQLAYNLNFSLPPSPPVPPVTVHALDQEILLTWDETAESYRELDRVDVDEEGNTTYYEFQGYNIYQVNTPTVGPNTEIIKLATYDIIDGVMDIQDNVFSEEFGENVTATVQRASDSGIRRSIRITTDAINGGIPLNNWTTYWFVITSYGYNSYGIPRILEAPFTTVECVPQQHEKGVRTKADYNDLIAAVTPDTTFNAEHISTAALSDGQLEIYVADPTEITGKDYQILFETTDAGQLLWHLERNDDGTWTRILENQTNQTGDEAYNIVDGIQVKSIGPFPTFKRFLCVANANGPLDPPDMGCYAFNNNGFPTLDDLPGDGVNDRPDDTRQQSNGSTWGFHTGFVDHPDFEDDLFSFFVMRVARNDNYDRLIPYDFELRFTEAGGYANWAYDDGITYPVPFEIWNIGINTPDDPSDDYRLIPWVLNDIEDPNDHVYNLNAVDHPVSGGNNDPYLDWIYWIRPTDTSPGTAGYDAFVAAGTDYDFSGDELMGRTVLVNWNGGDVEDPTFPANVDAVMPETGTVFRIITSKPNTVNDKYTFTTANYKPESSEALAKAAVQQVNIFPNPYFGRNSAEVNPVTRFVTLTHVPKQDVTIRIFTLAGSLIKTIDDDIRSTQGTLGTNTAQWDLRNDFDVPVASGIYIIHVDMGKLGEKVLKAAVFMPEERLDRF